MAIAWVKDRHIIDDTITESKLSPDVRVKLNSGGSGSGDVVGPAGSTENAIARFDGLTGKLLDNSAAFINDLGEISAANLSGTNTGDQTITLTGDVTGTGTGSFATTIPIGSVALGKLQDIDALSVIGRSFNTAGVPDEIAAASDHQVLRRNGTSLAFGALNLASSNAITGDLPVANLGGGSGASASTFWRGDGSWNTPVVEPSDGDKGDITVSGGGLVWTIDNLAIVNAQIANTTITGAKLANNTVAFGKLQTISTDTLYGRDAASTGSPTEIAVGGGIEFTGSNAIQRSALSGDVDAPAGSGITTLASIITAGGPTGSATVVPVITYDAKGRLTAVTTSTIAIPSTAVTDFTEAAQDAIGAMVDSTLVYSDGTPSLGVVNDTSTQKVEVAKNSAAPTGTRSEINFIEGSNVTLTVVDDAGNNRVNVTVAASGGITDHTALSNLNWDDADHASGKAGDTGGLDNYRIAGWGYQGPGSEGPAVIDVLTPNKVLVSVQNGAGPEHTWTPTSVGDVIGYNAYQYESEPFGIPVGVDSPDAQLFPDWICITRAADPTVTDDDGDEIYPGNFWFNTSAGTLFQNISNSTGAAVWKRFLNDGENAGGDLTGTYPSPSIANDAVTFAKMQNITTDRLLGRDSSGTGNVEEITVAAGGLEFSGSGALIRSALTGDVTASAASNTLTIPNNTVTFAKMQDISAGTDGVLLGKATGSGDPELININPLQGISISGGVLQREALTGDVTASAGGATTTIANDAVTYAKMQNVSAGSKLLGRGNSGSGDVEEITLGSGLTMTGTTLSSSGGSGITDGDKGDVTVSSSGTVWTVDNNAITLAKMATIATQRLLGRTTASTGDVEVLSVTSPLALTPGSGALSVDIYSEEVEVDFGATEQPSAMATVSASYVLTTSKIICSIAMKSTTDHDIEDVVAEGLQVFAGNIQNGVGFDVYINAPNNTWGKYKVQAIIYK